MSSESRVSVITGAAGGIGLGIARACIARDMKVMISDIDADRLARTAVELGRGGGVVAHAQCDVSDRASVDKLRDATLAAYGRVDLVFNNAGIGLSKPVLDTTDADWDLLFGVNVDGVVNGIRSFLPVLAEQGSGHMCATASLSGLVSDPDLVIYNGTKFAVVGMMEALAFEMERSHPGVSCSVLCPGPVATDLMMTSRRHLKDVGSAGDSGEYDELLANGEDPDVVGRGALDDIEAGSFWLLPHSGLAIELVEKRLEAMRRGQLRVLPPVES